MYRYHMNLGKAFVQITPGCYNPSAALLSKGQSPGPGHILDNLCRLLIFQFQGNLSPYRLVQYQIDISHSCHRPQQLPDVTILHIQRHGHAAFCLQQQSCPYNKPHQKLSNQHPFAPYSAILCYIATVSPTCMICPFTSASSPDTDSSI